MPRVQAEARRGHDRERSLAPAQQARQIESGVVLLQPVEASDHPTVGEHRLDTDELAARRSVAQYVYATRVRGHGPADRRHIARAEIDSVLPARIARLCLQARERHARLRGDLARARVDRPDLVEAPEIEDELSVQRHRSADEAGVAALGNDGRTGGPAQTHDRGDFVGARGANDRVGRAAEPAGPVDDVLGDDVRIRTHVRRADHVAQGHDQIGRSGHRRDARAAPGASSSPGEPARTPGVP